MSANRQAIDANKPPVHCPYAERILFGTRAPRCQLKCERVCHSSEMPLTYDGRAPAGFVAHGLHPIWFWLMFAAAATVSWLH